jgi:hypothetical protein
MFIIDSYVALLLATRPDESQQNETYADETGLITPQGTWPAAR